jgi:hypothetical protein
MFNNLYPWLLVLISLLFSPSVWAQKVFPDSVWESAVIRDPVLGFAYGDANHDFSDDLVTVLAGKIVVSSFVPDGYPVPNEYNAGAGETFHRVWLIDDGTGTQDILINGFVGGRVFSKMLRLNGREFTLRFNKDSLVVPLFIGGTWRLCEQIQFGARSWSNEVHYVDLKNGILTSTGFFTLGQGLSGVAPSLLATAGMGDAVVVWDDSGKIWIQNLNGKTTWKSGLSYGGSVDYVDVADRSLIGLNDLTRTLLPVRMAYEGTSRKLITAKNEGTLKSVVGAVPIIKSAQVVTLALGSAGFQETRVSPSFNGAITDIQLVDFDHDGAPEMMVSFLIHKGGSLDSLTRQSSLLVVWEIP